MRFKIRAIALYSFLFAVIVSQGQESTTNIVYPDIIFPGDEQGSTNFYGEKIYRDGVLTEIRLIHKGQINSRTIRNYDWNMEISTVFNETGEVSSVIITPFTPKKNGNALEDIWKVEELFWGDSSGSSPFLPRTMGVNLRCPDMKQAD